MSAKEYKLQLAPPAFVDIQVVGATVRLDVYQAHRMLAEAEAKSTPTERWAAVTA